MTDSDPSEAYRITCVPQAPEGADYDPADPFTRIVDRQRLQNYRDMDGFRVENVELLVPIAELEALADEWSTIDARYHIKRQECAEELRELIHSYTNE